MVNGLNVAFSFGVSRGFKILVQHLANMDKVPGALPVAQTEQHVLCPVQAGINIGVGFITNSRNLVGGSDKVAHYR